MSMTAEQFKQKLAQLITQLISTSKNKKELELTFESHQKTLQWMKNYLKLAKTVKETEELIGDYIGYDEWYKKIRVSNTYDHNNVEYYGEQTVFYNLGFLGIRMASYLKMWNGLDEKKYEWIKSLEPAWRNTLQTIVNIANKAKVNWEKARRSEPYTMRTTDDMLAYAKGVGIVPKN